MNIPLSPLAAALCLALAPGLSSAQTAAPAPSADGPVARLCRTAPACRAEADRLLAQRQRGATSQLAREQDLFYWFGRINMASTVANVELGIIPKTLAGPIARGVAHSIDQAARPGGKRPSDVLQTEKIITDAAGPEATLIHTGRSRQDMHSTLTMAQLRTELLDYAEALNGLRAQLLDMAEQHRETFVPAYTNGVQAQPISLAHYLLAFADSFERDGERLRQAWPRVDRSTLGTAVLANSSWPLNRPRLAELLGFGGLTVNGYDATQIAPADVGLEAAQIAGSNALRIGSLMQDVHVQYHQIRPWMLLAPGSTYTSSAMPQKANPGVIQNARTLASDVVASVQQVVMRAHNVTPGMIDYKYSWTTPGGARTFSQAVQLLRDSTEVMASLRIDKARALEELEAEWTTSMELAETLQHQHGIPFRVGHHFASEIVVHARKQALVPKTFPYAEAQRLYAEALRHYQLPGGALPLDEAAFRRTLSPADMVRSRVGLGGPQPAETARMLAESRKALAADRAWLGQRRDHLAAAEARLNNAFAELLAR
ncbi:MAG: argininosuccinate lyase [Burkholderiaceae bacterium]|nr:argininosuccinate lyase [Burkholderiaceae bacterium]